MLVDNTAAVNNDDNDDDAGEDDNNKMIVNEESRTTINRARGVKSGSRSTNSSISMTRCRNISRSSKDSSSKRDREPNTTSGLKYHILL